MLKKHATFILIHQVQLQKQPQRKLLTFNVTLMLPKPFSSSRVKLGFILPKVRLKPLYNIKIRVI